MESGQQTKGTTRQLFDSQYRRGFRNVSPIAKLILLISGLDIGSFSCDSLTFLHDRTHFSQNYRAV